MTMPIPTSLSESRFIDEQTSVEYLLKQLLLKETDTADIAKKTTARINKLRNERSLSLLEEFLAEYGLSSSEGVALMCLAEAFLRTPDAPSLDALIRDKVGSGNWEQHLGAAQSFLINASSWGLMLTGKIVGSEPSNHKIITDSINSLIAKLSEPVIRKAVEQIMKVLGQQFVLGTNIQSAIKRAQIQEKIGYRYSYDMLGEAAITNSDAENYFLSYSNAISSIASYASMNRAIDNPGISIKLSALHPRYESVQLERLITELVPRVSSLALLSKSANIGFTIDAEESERLELSLNIVARVLTNPMLSNWDGFGIVVQAYSKQALQVIDWVYNLAKSHDRRVTVRLVKGAYWDTEIKQAQVQGLSAYPVFTRKQSTDLSYLVCAEKLLSMNDRIYSQFATHNAHSMQSVTKMALPGTEFEFQRLHGMGESLHELNRQETGLASRIYAPVGVHKDLLAYLVRRLLENGANSSFIHQLHDSNTPVEAISTGPVEALNQNRYAANPLIPLPKDLFGHSRRNSTGISLNLPLPASQLEREMCRFQSNTWIAKTVTDLGQSAFVKRPVLSPVDHSKVGYVYNCKPEHAKVAITRSETAFKNWLHTPIDQRANILCAISDLLEKHTPELAALATREAGKTRLDCISEIREAVDFCRFYADEARHKLDADFNPRGCFVCISPWNFPLAIFTGQIVAALVTGNTVLAKPAEQTPLIASRVVSLMHEAGIPEDALILLPGDGSSVGAALTQDPRVAGVCFTGSTQTAEIIDLSLAKYTSVDVPFIAETGGINTMIVDSTVLLEQAVKDIINSSFQSAGQRCSALRLLIVQEDIAPELVKMLEGAVKELRIGDPWSESVDIGPIIDIPAMDSIRQYCNELDKKDQLLFSVKLPDTAPPGNYFGPRVYRISRFEDLDREIFGPVLHILNYKENQFAEVVNKINASGYGLTLGIQSRIDDRIEQICTTAHVGNIYVNRNQIGAVVGVQPFGGENKSGTGPKAGGPFYLYRFCKYSGDIQSKFPVPYQNYIESTNQEALKNLIDFLPDNLREIGLSCIEKNFNFCNLTIQLQGPTGETNILRLHPRGTVLCIGDDSRNDSVLVKQITLSIMAGNSVYLPKICLSESLKRIIDNDFSKKTGVSLLEGGLIEILSTFSFQAVAVDNMGSKMRDIKISLAEKKGARIVCLSSNSDIHRYSCERVISVDTTAAGGNASLLGISS